MPAVNRYYSSVAVDTTLSFSITDSSLTLVVGSTAGFPTSYPYTLALGFDLSNEELVTIVSASGTTLTVGTTVAGGANIAGRGVDGTNDQAHTAGEPVKHVISARDMTEAQAHIAAEATAHGITGNFVGTTDTQTLTNKTITGGTVNATTLQKGGVDAALTTDARFNPVGVTLPYAGSSAPTGYLLCDGASVSRSTYSALFGVVGTTYGSVDGSTFNVPNLKDKVPVGKNATGTFSTLGATGGAETVALSIAELAAHTHSTPALSNSFTSGNGSADHVHGTGGQSVGHSHANTVAGSAYERSAGTPAGSGILYYTRNSNANNGIQSLLPGVSITNAANDVDHNHGNTYSSGSVHTHTTTVSFAASTSGSAGSGTAHNNLQPYIVLNYIIKY
jgi:microcystin-dependent protein